MNLIIDIGNTNTKLSLFSDSELLEKQNAGASEAFGFGRIDAFLQKRRPKAVILSSVRSREEKLLATAQRRFGQVVQLNSDTPLPIENCYATPQTLGNDRLAAAVGAIRIFPDTNVLIIDSGTAVTIDFINNKGQFLGGNISPGLATRFRALHHFTGQLPLLEPQTAFSLLGNTTNKAIVAGVQNGLLFEIDGYAGHFMQLHKGLEIILTGGDAQFIKEHLPKHKMHLVPDLVPTGLNAILQHNKR